MSLLNKKSIIILILISLIMCIIGLSYFIYNFNKPFNIYERAYSQTIKENKIFIKNTLITSGDIEELNSQSIEYSVDKNKKIIDIIKNNGKDNEKSQLLIEDKKLYLKTEDEKYVNITNSSYLDEFTNNMKIEGNNVYDEFQQQIRDSFDKNNILKEKINKRIGDIDYKLIELTLTVPKEKAKEIISSYIKKDFSENSQELVEETILAQEQSILSTGKSLSNEDKKKLENEMLNLLKTNLEKKIESMDYSDITIKVCVDTEGYIRYREESYDIIIGEKTNTLKNITEYVLFGNNVEITNPKKIDIIDFETYIKEQKEKHKEEIKDFALENPDEDLSISNVKQKTEEKNKQEVNKN